MYCRLQQQISCCQEIGGIVTRESNQHSKDYICRVWYIPEKIKSVTGTNFISDRFQQFCKTINVEQAVSSVYHHQSNRQVEACIKFIKCRFKKCANSGRDINMALLQIHKTPLGQGLPCQATLMFNRKV